MALFCNFGSVFKIKSFGWTQGSSSVHSIVIYPPMFEESALFDIICHFSIHKKAKKKHSKLECIGCNLFSNLSFFQQFFSLFEVRKRWIYLLSFVSVLDFCEYKSFKKRLLLSILMAKFYVYVEFAWLCKSNKFQENTFFW